MGSRFTTRLAQLCLVACAALLAGCGGGVDPQVVGEWNTFAATPQGVWTVTLIVDEDGAYTATYIGFPARPHERGVIDADDGEFVLDIEGGERDEGTYALTSANAMTVVGKRGTVYWQRAGTMPAGVPPIAQVPSPSGVAVPPALPTNKWPLEGVPSLARSALDEARKWRGDAIARGVSAELVATQGGMLGNVQTNAGIVTLEFYFCSPGSQLTKVIRPGGTEYPEQAGECDATRAMPDFPDFPAALELAKARGMVSSLPKSIAIEDMNGRGVSGEDLTDWVWRVVPAQSSRDSVQVFALNPAAERVRVVDACAVIALADAERAMRVKLTQGKAPYTTGNSTWSCAYKSPSGNSPGMTIQIDESPFRDKRGVMAMAQRAGRTPVPGLGDEAYFQLPGSGVASLTILLGDTLLELGVWGAADNEAAIKELGRLAVTRVVQGDGVATRASLSDQLVGNWTAKLYDRSAMLTVRPDHSVNLQMAGEVIGVMNTTDNRYSLMTRARRALFDGQFEIPRAGRLVTRGPVEAQWHATSAPAQIHRTLLTAGMLTDAPADAGPWPETKLDAGLVGLWESNGKLNGRDARMLWRIRKSGPSQLTWALSGNGFIEAPNVAYDRVIVHFAEQLVADARNIGAPIDAELTVNVLTPNGTFVTPGWSGFNGDLTWTRLP